MNHIHDLRRALEIETKELSADFPLDMIRHRAHRLRTRQRVTKVAVAVVAVAAATVPATALTAGSGQAPDAGQVPWMSACSTESPDDAERDFSALGPLLETGVILDVPAREAQYDVIIGLIGTRDTPGFVWVFRDRDTGATKTWDTALHARDANGDLPGKPAGDPAYQFFSSQLALGENSVLDVGLYTRTAHRITVASEGQEADAEMTHNAETGWTLFWVQRTATPLPPDRFTVPGLYEGPEQVTVTAYDSEGQIQHTASGVHIGGSVANPRDGWPDDEEATPLHTSPPPCPPPASTTP